MLTRIGELREIARRRLNVGCGTVKIPGSVNVDIQGDADVIADARSLPFPDASIHWLESHHCLEHFSREEAQEVLQEWARVLIPGGLMLITVPDLPRCFEVILQNLDTPEMWRGFMGSIYGIQNDPYDFHKYGYSLPALMQEIANQGFEVEGFNWPYRPTPTMGVLGRKNNGKEAV